VVNVKGKFGFVKLPRKFGFHVPARVLVPTAVVPTVIVVVVPED
jgi:hypothetical protein